MQSNSLQYTFLNNTLQSTLNITRAISIAELTNAISLLPDAQKAQLLALLQPLPEKSIDAVSTERPSESPTNPLSQPVQRIFRTHASRVADSWSKARESLLPKTSLPTERERRLLARGNREPLTQDSPSIAENSSTGETANVPHEKTSAPLHPTVDPALPLAPSNVRANASVLYEQDSVAKKSTTPSWEELEAMAAELPPPLPTACRPPRPSPPKTATTSKKPVPKAKPAPFAAKLGQDHAVVTARLGLHDRTGKPNPTILFFNWPGKLLRFAFFNLHKMPTKMFRKLKGTSEPVDNAVQGVGTRLTVHCEDPNALGASVSLLLEFENQPVPIQLLVLWSRNTTVASAYKFVRQPVVASTPP